MGGANGYARPVNPTGLSTWRAHTNRGTPSTEPGTDYYCPIGTPIRAAAGGWVVDVGNSIQPATGRYITIDLDDGRRVRYLHILRRHRNVGDYVQWGEHIADSGATGYGEEDWSWNVAETGGAHVHMTLWAHQRYTFGRYATLDPEIYMAAEQGGGNFTEDDMFTDEDRERLNATYAALFGSRNITGKHDNISWVNIYGDVQSSDYGVLPIVIHNQSLIAKQTARIAELEKKLQEKSD